MTDPVLAHLIDQAANGLNPTVVLSVHGQIVSGTLISESEYLKLWTESMVRGYSAGAPEDKRAGVETTVRNGLTLFTSRIMTDDHDRTLFIHLRDARIFFGNVAVPTNQGVLLRVRAHAVDAFSIGRLEEGNDAP